MKGSFFTISFFVAGCAVGVFSFISVDVHQISVYILYVLMFFIGMNIGGNQNLKDFVAILNFRSLLVPLATVGGTVLFSALAALVLSQWSMFDCMAVGSGLAYYSLSSMLITQLKTASMGVQIATELGTIALLSNIFRELIALMAAPFIRKHFGLLAPISAAGMGSGDISLNVIAKNSGPEVIPVAIMHGLLINISVPFFVSLFCNM